MRRRPGFTMIEVLMVLVVVATLAVFTITVGQRWEQRRVEDAFFERVRTEWQYELAAAKVNGKAVVVNWDVQNYVVEFSNPKRPLVDTTGTVRVVIPRTLVIGGSSFHWNITAKGKVTQPHETILSSTVGPPHRVAIEMEWGQLDIGTVD